MNYFKLAYTTPDVLEKIKEAEKNGDFNAHIDPIDYSNCQPVDENFPYIPAGLQKFRQVLIRTFIISPFMWIVNRFIFRTKIYKDYGNEKNKPDKYTIIKNNNVIRQSYKNINGNITVQSYVNNSMIKDTSKNKTDNGFIQSSPVYSFTVTYQKQFWRTRITIYIDGPFLPDNTISQRQAAGKLRNQVYDAMTVRSRNSTYEKVKYIKTDNCKT